MRLRNGFTPCEIGLGLPQAARSCRRCPCCEARPEAFAQRLAARLVSSRKAYEAAVVELSPHMFRDGNRFHTGRYYPAVPAGHLVRVTASLSSMFSEK